VHWLARPQAHFNVTAGDITVVPRPILEWQPVTEAVYKFVWSLSGGPLDAALPYLWFVSLCLHAATCGALFTLGAHLHDSMLAGVMAAIFFAVHPILADTVRGVVPCLWPTEPQQLGSLS
jgi:hypothetical protein